MAARAAGGDAGDWIFQQPIIRDRRRGPFLKAVEEFGFVAERNVAIDYRFSEGRDERLPQIAADLVVRSVSLLVATDRPSAMAAKAATPTIGFLGKTGLTTDFLIFFASLVNSSRRKFDHGRAT